jgi:hypothetical protein
VIEELMGEWSFVNRFLQAFTDKVLPALTDFNFGIKNKRPICDCFCKSNHPAPVGLIWYEGVSIIEQEVCDDAQRPNITFLVIFFPL